MWIFLLFITACSSSDPTVDQVSLQAMATEGLAEAYVEATVRKLKPEGPDRVQLVFDKGTAAGLAVGDRGALRAARSRSSSPQHTHRAVATAIESEVMNPPKTQIRFAPGKATPDAWCPAPMTPDGK